MGDSHVSWSVRVTVVPLDGTEASEESASSGERGSHAGNLEIQEKKYCFFFSLQCAVTFTIFNVWWFPSLKLHFLHKNDVNVRLQVSQ